MPRVTAIPSARRRRLLRRPTLALELILSFNGMYRV